MAIFRGKKMIKSSGWNGVCDFQTSPCVGRVFLSPSPGPSPFMGHGIAWWHGVPAAWQDQDMIYIYILYRNFPKPKSSKKVKQIMASPPDFSISSPKF